MKLTKNSDDKQLNQFQFNYKGKVYECIGDDREFQIFNFKFAIEDKQWVTVENRIINQLKFGPVIREIKNV
jgi:hypothetical protein